MILFTLNAILWTDCQIYHIELSTNIQNHLFKLLFMKFTIVYFVRFFYLCSPSAHLTIVLSVVVKDCVYHTAAMCTRPRTGFQPEPESEVTVSIISESER